MTTPTHLPRRWEAVADPATSGRRSSRRSPVESIDPWRIAGGLALCAAAALWAWAATWQVRPMGSAIVVLPVAALLGAWLCRRDGTRFGGADLSGLLFTGLALRFLGLWARYREASDALEYHREGTRLASSYRSLDFVVDVGRPIPGTGSVRVVAGLVHAVSFDDLLVSFTAFTLVAFLGCLLFLRAVRVALPDADHHRYAMLVMLWPSLWFWPSSLGKEALMLFGIGAASLGAARLLTHTVGRGLVWLTVGLASVGFVRPHVGLLVVAALAVAVILRSGDRRAGRTATRVVAAVAVLLGGALLSDATANRFQVDALGTEQISQTLEYTATQTSTGNATFTPVQITSPVQVPGAVVTVLFRPLPGESRSPEGLATSLEGAALALLLVLSIPRLTTAARRLRRDPYLLYALSFVLLFIYAFSVIGNFGILARQRTQVLPLLFVALAVPAATRIGPWRGRATRRRARNTALADHPDRHAPVVGAREAAAFGPRPRQPTRTERPRR